MSAESRIAESPQLDPAALIRRIRDQAASTVAACDQALVAVEAAAAGTQFRVEGESADHLDYREARRPDGRLSELGRHVARAFLLAGFTDEAVAKFMTVSPWGIGQYRRRINLPYGHRQAR